MVLKSGIAVIHFPKQTLIQPLCAYALDQRALLGSLFPQAVIHGRDLDRPIEARGCKTQQGHAVWTTGHRQAQFAFWANGGKIGPEAC